MEKIEKGNKIDLSKVDKKIMLLAPLEDQQSGLYVMHSLFELRHAVAPFDFRDMIKRKGSLITNITLLEKIKELGPSHILVLKGLELDKNIFVKIKEKFPDIVLINWIFDVTINGTKVEECKNYVEFAKVFDFFFTIAKGSVKKLREKGINAFWVPEGCYPPMHKEVVLTWAQEKKFSSDISFIGTIGGVHKGRIEVIKALIDEGFDVKIWGDIVRPEEIPEEVLKAHTGHSVINEYHSIVAQCSKINIGFDGWPDVELSQSARVYRILCAGGFLLTNHTKNIEQMFEPEKHLTVYENVPDLIEKVYKYLNDDELRQKIAKEGQKLVKEKYKFTDSFKKMFKIVDNEINQPKKEKTI